MINTISKTLGAQEMTQDIKQSPSMKIGTKPYARSRRNELTEVTGRWRKVIGCSDHEARQQARPDAGGRSTGRRTAESGQVQRFQSGENATECVRWHVTGRWQRPISGSRLQRSGQPNTSGQDVIGVRSVAEKRDFVPNGYFLSGAYK